MQNFFVGKKEIKSREQNDRQMQSLKKIRFYVYTYIYMHTHRHTLNFWLVGHGFVFGFVLLWVFFII